ncbi:hypothetical protein TELCIR_07441 [Teladorsagia circumcincta]|uniref:Uncharacterized protein n=1 Tax=Teladorsagia circumcincta TaxID=45464 RepID=A0A2G9UKA1_TELCI|nr:hypothetical protein TELCIR_07441 [Teladorsagia circumcincta]
MRMRYAMLDGGWGESERRGPVSNCGGKSTPSEVIDERPSRRRNFSHGMTRCVRSSSANPLMVDYHMHNMDVTTDTDDLGKNHCNF